MKNTKKIFVFYCACISPAFSGGAYTSPPSILQECMDSGGYNPFKSPSSRAKECTRVFCGTDEFISKIKKYALQIAQSEQDNLDALVCITRKDRDLKSER
jgi:hypothetical protein